MSTWIALLRGINVGGKNKLSMKELRAELEELGLENVRTYIQSGNVVFESKRKGAAKLAKDIRTCIADAHGFEPATLVVDAAAVRAAMKVNPFPEAQADPRSVHLAFLETKPKPDLALAKELCAASERFALKGQVFYLHAPDGIGRSKLAAQVERVVGVTATARNWRTVRTLAELAEG